MSGRPPINGEQAETPAPLPANAKSIIREDLERIRKRKRASNIAWVILILLSFDLLVVSSIDFGVRDQTIVTVFRHRGRTVSFPGMSATFLQTPEGVRIASEVGHDRSTIEKQFGTFPPRDWQPIAIAYPSPPHFYANGYGLLTPFIRQRDFQLHVFSADHTTLLTDPKWREMYCDWLATGVAWKSSHLDDYVAGMRKGDHVESSYSILLLLHDMVFVAAGCASIGVHLIGIVNRTSRSARRVRAGHCPHCSYDLLSDFSRGCPECGWGKEP